MGNIPLSERIRNWIGEVAFDVFLWAVRMSADEYFDMIMSDGGLTKRVPDALSAPRIPCTCGQDDGLHEWDCAISRARR